MIKEEEIKTESMAENDEELLEEAEMVADDESADEIVEEISPEEVLKEIVKEDEAVLNRLVRLQADFENFKKRSQKEKNRNVSLCIRKLCH